MKLGKKVSATISSQKKAEEHHRPAPEPAPGFAEPSVIPSISYGTIAAFRLAKYFDEIPQIGKVTNIDKETVTVQWYIGGYNNLWIEWKKDGKVQTEIVPKNAVIYSGIQFTKGHRLKAATKKLLKDLYESKELI